VSGGDHRWFKRSTGKKRPVTRDDNIIIIIIIINKYKLTERAPTTNQSL